MIILRLLGAVWCLSFPAASNNLLAVGGSRNYIMISTRNSLNQEQEGEVLVEYSIWGIRLGSVNTGQDGTAVIRPRCHL